MLGNVEDGQEESVVFPTEDEMMEILTTSTSQGMGNAQDIEDTEDIATNSPFLQDQMVVWDENDGKKWYIGQYLDDNDDGTFRVSHFKPKDALRQDWISPRQTDIQDVNMQQVVPVSVQGHWDFSGRIPKYVVENLADICATFSEISG